MGFYSYTYGTFSAKFARLNVSEDTLFAEDGITQIGVKYNFNINGWITSPTIAGFQQNLQCAQGQMHTPRLALLIQWSPDGMTWTTLYSFDSTNDIDYGPKPNNFNVIQFSGGLAGVFSCSISVTAKTCYNNCTPFNRPSQVLAIMRRWSYNINESGFTTRTLSGKILVTSQSVQNGFPADSFRALVAPPLPLNFKRESQNYDSSENGREMTFSVVDKQANWTLPVPITGGNASFTIRTLPGLQQHFTLTGRFEAPSSITKQQIYDQVAILALAKIPPQNQAVLPIFESRTITEDVYGNALNFHFEYNAPNDNNNQIDLLSPSSGWPFGQQPPGSNGISQTIGPYGGDGTTSSGVNTPGTPIYDACTSTVTPGGGGGGGSSGGNPSSTPPPTNTTTNQNYGGDGQSTQPPGTVPIATGGSSHAHLTNMFYSYHEELMFCLNTGLKVFPSKVSGVKPLVQKVSEPLMTVIQAGYQTQNAANPQSLSPPPDPFLSADMGALTDSAISTTNGEPSASPGLSLFTTRWTYTMIYTLAAPSTTSQYGIAYSNDNRTAIPTGGIMMGVPALLPPL